MFQEGLPPHLLPVQDEKLTSPKEALESKTHLRGNTEALFFSLPHSFRSHIHPADLPTMRTVVRGYARLALACESRQDRLSQEKAA